MALSEKAKADGRWRAQTDLFFLGRDILHYDLEEQPHREMCGFFVAKDPRKTLAEQSEVKERQMLLSRGCFKSTIDVIDSAQWIICFPDVRILHLTAEKELSEAYAEELKNIFTVQEDAATDFQILFPEFCLQAGKKEAVGDFVTPARSRYFKEPTFWSNSISSRLPGWHCNILKLDDVVNDVNSESPEQREKIIRRVNMARKLRDPGGYIDVIGTPYDPDDYYSYQRQHANPKKFMFISHAAWTLKSEAKRKELSELVEGDIEKFYFPSRLDWDYLKNELDTDPDSFASQYLIDATRKAGAIVKFTENLLDEATVPWQSVSQFCSYYAIWDLAYGVEGSTKNKPCLTAGGVWAVDDWRRMVLVELIAGYFDGDALAEAFVGPMTRYPLQYSAVEDANGTKWLVDGQIKRSIAKHGLKNPSIIYIPVDRTEDAKHMRIALVPALMRDKMMLISDACIEGDFVREQLLRYTGKKKSPRDVADMFGLTARHLGNYVPSTPQTLTEEEYEKQVKVVQERAMREILFPSMSEPVIEAPIEEPVTNYF